MQQKCQNIQMVNGLKGWAVQNYPIQFGPNYLPYK